MNDSIKIAEKNNSAPSANIDNASKELLINKINQSEWWHVPPQDNNSYFKRGKFLASTFAQAEFYGRPNDTPERVHISNPLIGFNEQEILQVLFPSNWEDLWEKINDDNSTNWYQERIALDRKMYVAGKKLGYDSIVLLTQNAKKALQSGKKPSSIELNILEV